MDTYWSKGSVVMPLYITIIEMQTYFQSHKKDNLKLLIVPCDLLNNQCLIGVREDGENS